MKNFFSIGESMVDLRSRTRWDLNFIEEYQSFNKRNHEFENIYAKFSYKSHWDEIEVNMEDWDTFKNFIANDFNNLKYPPCHLYINRSEVTAFWFIPDILLLRELGSKEEQIIMENLKKQLIELKHCILEKISACGGDREIDEDLYLEYFRKKRFLEALLCNNIEKSDISSTKGEA
ncbi:hypothetical protein [Alkalihalobacillus pseudalcaliphilus]|uniref:hypothetical protein n=1 Tax=Alkalihalobacillus pseudalcaliphilus TaxID=79884 RepID=UPI00064DC69E|nr:hypothetical protein [Alkalihalobacillus pseudalcaliphilus]KMK77953.1 hypothetical protein AB990_00380 [Alkalihalobacillus pseudalcaliphilus]